MLFNRIMGRPFIVFENEGGGGGGNGGGSTGNKEQSEVEKAYAKLRDAEAEARALRAENNQLKQDNKRIETLEKERDEAIQAKDKAEGDLMTFTTEKSVTETARTLKFRNPKTAMDILKGRNADLSDDTKIKKALEDLAKEDAGLLGEPAASTPPPPPSGGPINAQNGGDQSGANFNTAIRSAAGRPVPTP